VVIALALVLLLGIGIAALFGRTIRGWFADPAAAPAAGASSEPVAPTL
jgi:hypothetical protein